MAANPAALQLMRAIKGALPELVTVYGGVYPTYAAEELMSAEAAVDFIVRGEGEVTAFELISALRAGQKDFACIDGLVWRSGDKIIINRSRQPIADLDRSRVAWELADWPLYENHHLPGRTAIMQFSRGCPHACTYCGQRMFWKQWRHRSIERFVDQLQHLREAYGVRTVWIADENWACVPELFNSLLESIAERDTGIHLFCAMCAKDIVRDADRLPLYRRAGITCLMLGAESFDDEVLARIGKNNPFATTARAVQLLRQHDILSVVNVIYGLRHETWGTLCSTWVHLHDMSPDFFNALHLTPLSWTIEGHQIKPARIAQLDQRKWDFRQPVIHPAHFSPKTLALLVKVSEALFYLRPFHIFRNVFARDPVKRAIMRDAFGRLARVYVSECFETLQMRFCAPGQALRNPSQLRLLMPGLAEPIGQAEVRQRKRPWSPDVGAWRGAAGTYRPVHAGVGPHH
jgi:anaerobic magnesium-protoporphyrin IX monomethyl ester cyclase